MLLTVPSEFLPLREVPADPEPAPVGCSIPSWKATPHCTSTQHHSYKEYLKPFDLAGQQTAKSLTAKQPMDKRKGETASANETQKQRLSNEKTVPLAGTWAPKLEGRQVRTTNKKTVMRDLCCILEKKK